MNYGEMIKECDEGIVKIKKEIHMMRTSIGVLERTMQTMEIFSHAERKKINEAIDVFIKTIEFDCFLIEEWQKRKENLQKLHQFASEFKMKKKPMYPLK